MASLAPVTVTTAWTLVYDGVASGAFNGAIGYVGGSIPSIYVGPSAPAAAVDGPDFQGIQGVSISATDKLYCKCAAGTSSVAMLPDLATLPSSLFNGTSSITVEGFVESNVKNGTQFEASNLTAALAAGANQDVIIQVGAKPVVLKGRNVEFNGESLEQNIYRAPTFTGGVAVPVFNLNDVNPVASSVTILSGATVTVPGTQVFAPSYFVGSVTAGTARTANDGVAGLERILRPNTTYLLRLTNTGTNTERVGSYSTWYEGPFA